MKIGSLKVDSNLYDNGRWVDAKDLPVLQDIRLHVRALDSYEARGVRAEMLMALPDADRKAPTPEQSYAIDAAVLARGVLRGWEGIEDGGAQLAFDAEVAEQFLGDRDYRRLKDFVQLAAALVQAEAGADMESATKN